MSKDLQHPRYEDVACLHCGAESRTPFIEAEDDLTGKAGRWSFVTCDDCGLAYQHPRIVPEHIGAYYDDEYIAHRKKTDFGILTPFYNRAMGKHDRRKVDLVRRYVDLNEDTNVLDLGCAVGSFLQRLRQEHGAQVAGVDFKDLSGAESLEGVDFRCGVLRDVEFEQRFDLVTMWHFLEHDYEPAYTLERSRDLITDEGRVVIEVPRLDSLTFKLYGDRWPGLQAPQHTALYDWDSLERLVEGAGLEIVDHLPWGAFPPYFYLFAGVAFKLRKGKGIDPGKAVVPYFLGQLLCTPALLLEKQLNLAMQTIVCRRKQ
jgi:SAM-dependent methyltransferase